MWNGAENVEVNVPFVLIPVQCCFLTSIYDSGLIMADYG